MHICLNKIRNESVYEITLLKKWSIAEIYVYHKNVFQFKKGELKLLVITKPTYNFRKPFLHFMYKFKIFKRLLSKLHFQIYLSLLVKVFKWHLKWKLMRFLSRIKWDQAMLTLVTFLKKFQKWAFVISENNL